MDNTVFEQVVDKNIAYINGNLCENSFKLNSYPKFFHNHNFGKCLSQLNLDHIKLNEFPTGLGKSLSVLQFLSLNGNALKSLPEDIGLMLSLQVLFVNDNSLIRLPESLQELKQLQRLEFSCNKLRALHSELGQNISLQILKVKQNRLKKFPSTLGLLHNLKILEASENNIEYLPLTMNFMQSLNVVNLNNNNLQNIPETFGELRNLTILDFSNNKLTTLCDNFKSTATLEVLCLDFNMFSALPLWVGALTNIKEISVKYNKLDNNFLPGGFRFLSKKLTKVDLSGNLIYTFPDVLCKLKSLQILSMGIRSLSSSNHGHNGALSLCRNWICSLPDSFVNLKLLTELNLEDNQLRSLPNNFGTLMNLEKIYLGYNLIDEIPQSFSHLVALRVCHLSENCLKMLPNEFGALENLVELHLDFNQLIRLPESIQNLVKLEILNLKGNTLEKSSLDLVHGMNNLKELNVDGNLDKPYTGEDEEKMGDDENEPTYFLGENNDFKEENLWTCLGLSESVIDMKNSNRGTIQIPESWDDVETLHFSKDSGQFDDLVDDGDSKHHFYFNPSPSFKYSSIPSYNKYYSHMRTNLMVETEFGQFENIDSQACS